MKEKHSLQQWLYMKGENLLSKGMTIIKLWYFSQRLTKNSSKFYFFTFFIQIELIFNYICRCCNSKLLETVDNYALLDLDIAWCYLCLESFVQLPEAYERLKRCEERFQKTYGSNLERLIAVKGSGGKNSHSSTIILINSCINVFIIRNPSSLLCLLKNLLVLLSRV